MRGQPAFALADELLHFLVADGVVLAAIQGGDQHVQVGQQVGQADGRRSASREKYGLSPHSGNVASSGYGS